MTHVRQHPRPMWLPALLIICALLVGCVATAPATSASTVALDGQSEDGGANHGVPNAAFGATPTPSTVAHASVDAALRSGCALRFVRDEETQQGIASSDPPNLMGPDAPLAVLGAAKASHMASVIMKSLSAGAKEGAAAAMAIVVEPLKQAANLRFSSHSMATGLKHNAVPPKQIKPMPAELDFGDKPVCICHMETVTFVNVGEHAVEFNTVAIDSAHYHHSFHEPVTVEPRGNVTLHVVFLPLTVEDATTWMYVQTSVGSFLYKVSGRGISNSYGVASFQNIKVPPGVLFQRGITLSNPHADVLRIREVFTSGLPLFQLRLPDGVGNSSSSLRSWDLLPHQTKTLLLLTFLSRAQGRFQGAITIHTNKGTMMMRVDLLVSTGGIYLTSQKLDFFTLTNSRQTKRMRVRLYNSGPGAVLLSSIKAEEPDALLRCDYKQGLVIGMNAEVTVGEVEFRGLREGVFSGRLSVETTSPIDPVVHLPYSARVLHGSLKFSVANTTFYTPGASAALLADAAAAGDGLSEAATLTGDMDSDGTLTIVQAQEFTNGFLVPVTLFSAHVDDPRFTVVSFMPGITISPNASYMGLRIMYKGPPDPKIVRAHLTMQSNVAKEFSVPIWTFHGRLSVARINAKAWARLAAALPALFSDIAQRGMIVRETAICENNNPRSLPKYQGVNLSLQDLTDLFALFGLDRTHGNFGGTTGGVAATPSAAERFIMRDKDTRVVSDTFATGADAFASLEGDGDPTTKDGAPLAIDFGALSLGEVRRVRLNITNPNPRDIRVMRISTNLPSVTIKFEFVYNPASGQMIVMDAENGRDGVWIRQFHSAIYSVEVAATTEQKTAGKITIETAFEVTDVQLRYETVAGALELSPRLVHFPPSFPGIVRTAVVFGLSSYRTPLTILSVRSNDDRVAPVLRNHTLAPDVNSTLATIVFDPGRLEPATAVPSMEEGARRRSSSSKDLHYIPMDALRQLTVFGLSKRDLDAYNQNEYLWGRLRSTGRDTIDAMVTFHTSIVAQHDMQVIAKLKQPFLTNKKELHFPLTQYGHETERYITITNPSDSPVAIDAAAFYNPDPFVMDGESGAATAATTTGGANRGSGASGSGGASSFNLDMLYAQRGGKRLAEVPIIIAPHDQYRFGPVSFRPHSHTGTHEAMLLLKNNLTLFQPINLVGEGGTAVVRLLDTGALPMPYHIALNRTIDPQLYRMRASNVGPPLRHGQGIIDSEGKGAPLLFRVLSHHGAACAETPMRQVSLTLTFTLANMGTLPLLLHDMFIGSTPCAFRGFSVKPCLHDTLLAAGASLNVSVSFVPDFTTARTLQNLRFITSVGLIALPMEATVALDVLSSCHYATPELSGGFALLLTVVKLALVGGFVALCVWVARQLRATPALPVENAHEGSPTAATSSNNSTTKAATSGGNGGTRVAYTIDEVLADIDLTSPASLRRRSAKAAEGAGATHNTSPRVVDKRDGSPRMVLASTAVAGDSTGVGPAGAASVPSGSGGHTLASPTEADKAMRKGMNKRTSGSMARALRASGELAEIPPGIVKESVSIPARSATPQHRASANRVRLHRASSDSSHAESGEESSDDSAADKLGTVFSVRVESSADAFDAAAFRARLGELAAVDVKRIRIVTTSVPSSGSLWVECVLLDTPSDQKSKSRVNKLLKTSRAALAAHTGLNVIDAVLGAPARSPQLQPINQQVAKDSRVPVSVKSKKSSVDAKKTRKPVALAPSPAQQQQQQQHHQHAHHTLSSSAATAYPYVYTSDAQQPSSASPTSSANGTLNPAAPYFVASESPSWTSVGKLVGAAQASGKALPPRIVHTPAQQQPKSPPMADYSAVRNAATVVPPTVTLPAPLPSATTTGNGAAVQSVKPKRMFQPINLFHEDDEAAVSQFPRVDVAMLAPAPPAAIQSPSSSSSSSSSSVYLSVPPPHPLVDADTASPPLGVAAQGLLPRDLLSSSGGGFLLPSPDLDPQPIGATLLSDLYYRPAVGATGRAAMGPPSHAVAINSNNNSSSGSDSVRSPPVRLVQSDSAVLPMHSLFGTWGTSPSAEHDLGASLMSQLRAPRSAHAPPASVPSLITEAPRDQALFESHLNWIGDASPDDLMLDVGLEDDMPLEAPSALGLDAAPLGSAEFGGQSDFFSLFQQSNNANNSVHSNVNGNSAGDKN